MFENMIKKMDSVLSLVSDDLNQVKTGRAKPAMVNNIKVEAYQDQPLPLIELASITAPDTQMLVISPWDKSVLEAIQKAIIKSNIGLNPTIDSDLIRISVPPLTQERREEMVKLVKQRVESGRQMLRGVRNDKKREIDEMEGNPGVSEDDIKNHLDNMQKKFDDYMEKLENLGKNKEKELLEI